MLAAFGGASAGCPSICSFPHSRLYRQTGSLNVPAHVCAQRGTPDGARAGRHPPLLTHTWGSNDFRGPLASLAGRNPPAEPGRNPLNLAHGRYAKGQGQSRLDWSDRVAWWDNEGFNIRESSWGRKRTRKKEDGRIDGQKERACELEGQAWWAGPADRNEWPGLSRLAKGLILCDDGLSQSWHKPVKNRKSKPN